jgi:hypothetical protein
MSQRQVVPRKSEVLVEPAVHPLEHLLARVPWEVRVAQEVPERLHMLQELWVTTQIQFKILTQVELFLRRLQPEQLAVQQVLEEVMLQGRAQVQVLLG